MENGGYRVQGAGCRVQGEGCRVQGAGCRVQGAGFRGHGVGCRVQGAGCRVQGVRCQRAMAWLARLATMPSYRGHGMRGFVAERGERERGERQQVTSPSRYTPQYGGLYRGCGEEQGERSNVVQWCNP